MGRVQVHNSEVKSSAEHRAREMKFWPSPLEEKMKEFLDNHFIKYESQKIFYIYADDGWIIRYYIADFYVPDKNIIIEVDGKKYHDHHQQHDKIRTKIIQENYPDITVLRYTWNDLKDYSKMHDLLWKVS